MILHEWISYEALRVIWWALLGVLLVTAIFLPLILLYTAWVYKVLWHKVTAADVTDNSHSVY